MRLTPPRSGGLLATALLLAAPPALAQDEVWALTNARIETVTKGVIERGTIVIRGGMIESVGAAVRPPADARIVDLAGKTVYPGLIDLTSTIGLPAPPANQGGRGGGGAQLAALLGQAQGASQTGAPQYVGLEPARIIAGELRPAAADVSAARDLGITAALVAPNRGAFRGQSALIPLRDDSIGGFVVRSPVAMHMGFQGAPGRYPGTLLGVIAYERQMFYDAQRHAELMDRYKAGARGLARPSYDPALDALVPVVRGQMPVFFAASNENEIRRARRIADEFKLKLSIVGATEGFRALEAFKGATGTHVVTVDFPRPVDITGWSYLASRPREMGDSARADSAVRRQIEGNAAALHRAGVRFALASGGLRPSEFLANVRKAVAAGLPKDVAIQALTIRAAEAAGAGDQLGSIEPGKIAHLVVAEGDILAENPRIRTVFVDGTDYDVVPPTPQRGAGGAGRFGGGQRGGNAPAGGADAAAATGTWELTSTAPQGGQTSQGTLTLTQSGTVLDGSLRTEFGTVNITDGRIEGNQVTFTATLPISGQTTALQFRGRITGDRLQGTIDMGQQGTRQFTGRRTP